MKIRINDTITVRAKLSPTNSNYNIVAAIFRKGEKYPIAGTTFKSGTTKEQLKTWATDFVNKKSNQFLFD